MDFDSVDAVLDFAIEKEEEAHQFYMDLAKKMEKKYMTEIFEEFAKEEMGHKQKLIGIKSGKLLVSAEKKITDLKIGDYLVDVDPNEELDYQKALILAMKKEKKAFKLYNDLADSVDDQNLKSVYKSLAQEEAKHKLRFEIEYDDVIMRDN